MIVIIPTLTRPTRPVGATRFATSIVGACRDPKREASRRFTSGPPVESACLNVSNLNGSHWHRQAMKAIEYSPFVPSYLLLWPYDTYSRQGK